MMKRWIYGLILCFPLLWSCDDFLEKDLDDEIVELISPQNNDTLSSYNPNFWWEEVEGATHYRIQIATPSFSNPIALIVDSIVTDYEVTYTLDDGGYEWRVRAENNSTQSSFSTRNFTIIENQDLSVETINLVSPLNNNYTNDLTVAFRWSLLSKAESYLFNIDYDDGNPVFTNNSTTADSIVKVLPEEGTFIWYVQGINASSSTPASASRVLVVDTTSPAKPILFNPANQSTIDTTLVQFFWQTGSSLAPVSDSLFIYSDSLATLVDVISVNGSTQAIDFSSNGIYYWRVRSVDAANNLSIYSNVRTFTIN